MTDKEQLRILEEWLHLHKGLIFKIVRAYADTAMEQDDLGVYKARKRELEGLQKKLENG